MSANGGGYRAEDEYDYIFKVVLIGDSGVSKSNLCPAAARQHPAPSHCALLQRTHPPSALQRTHPPSALTTRRPHWSTGRRPKVRSHSPSSRLASGISSSPSPPAKESSSAGDVSPICLLTFLSLAPGTRKAKVQRLLHSWQQGLFSCAAKGAE